MAEIEKKKIGVIGAGVMGRSIALMLTQYGYHVILCDKSYDILQKAIGEIGEQYSMYAPFCEYFSNDDFITNITVTTELNDFSNIRFIIESATEDIDIKKSLYEQLDIICPSDGIIIMNTSCIPISRIAENLSHKENIVGVHFMNPVFMINTVELIKSKFCSSETIKTVDDFLLTIGKKSISVGDSAGFVSNRISHLMMNEAIKLVEEKVAEPEAIDAIFKQCYGHKLGPLETADLIGLDTVLRSLRVLYENYNSEKYKSSSLLEQMVEEGHCGRKTGCGFYDYEYLMEGI